MQVKGDRLCGMDGRPMLFLDSPNHGAIMGHPALIVLHYTGGTSLDNACAWLCNPKSKASAHLIVGQRGDVKQLVPLNRVAWHAGPSKWTVASRDPERSDIEYQNINQHSIGIEMVNPGPLKKRGDGRFYTRDGAPWPDDLAEFDGSQWWASYNELQVAEVLRACQALCEAFASIEDVVGHEDVAIPPGRKHDPGPAFDMEAFRSKLFGRSR